MILPISMKTWHCLPSMPESTRPPRPAKMPLWNAVVGRARLRKKTVRGLRYSSFLPKSRPKELGFSKRSLKEIARKSNEGFYINLIESLPIENDEKKRLLSDANIQEAEFTEELNDE